MDLNSKIKLKPTSKKKLKNISNEIKYLVLHNDDFNTFEFVINSLIEICHHDKIQAEQCTFIIHFKGKCDIKVGEYDYLKSLKKKLKNKGLKVTIE